MKIVPKIYTPRLSNPWRFCFKRFCNRHGYKIVLAGNFFLIGLPSAFLCWWTVTYTQLHVCLTPSLENTRVLLFYKSPSHQIKRGDIIAIQGHTYKYLGQKHYAKRIIGFPGDLIERELNAIKVGSRTLSLMSTTHEGQPLTPSSLTIIPKNYFFVAGDHHRSIDSRYEEFGLVHQNNVFGKAVFTW